MSKLSEKWRKIADDAREAAKSHEVFNPEIAIRYLSDAVNLDGRADELAELEAEIYALAEKAGIAIRDLNTPRNIADKFIGQILQKLGE